MITRTDLARFLREKATETFEISDFEHYEMAASIIDGHTKGEECVLAPVVAALYKRLSALEVVASQAIAERDEVLARIESGIDL
jgi:hypothetical protein